MRFYRLCSAFLLGMLLLAGCGQQTHPSVSLKSEFVFHIGHQRGDTLNLLKVRGDLERRLAKQGIKVDWVLFPAGPQLLEAMGVGSVYFGSTGESPAIFAQAAGNDLIYVANIPPSGSSSGDGQAIIVPQNSPIRTIADLKGKKIAFQKASSAHNFVIQIVERAGLTYRDIQPVYLSPPDARPAFDSGNIDAWAVWDPFLAAAQKRTNARVLVNSKGIFTAGSFYLAPRKFAIEHPELLKIVLEELNKAGDWVWTHKDEAAEILAKDTGIDLDTLKLLQSRAERAATRPVNEEVIKAQQTVADNFFKIGLLPKRLNVREAVLSPQQYAALTP